MDLIIILFLRHSVRDIGSIYEIKVMILPGGGGLIPGGGGRAMFMTAGEVPGSRLK